MQFPKLLIAAAAFAVAGAQTVKFTNTNFSGITVGSPFNITWSGATSDITLKLKNGPANAQLLVETIGSKFPKPPLKIDIKCFTGGLTGTYYVWTPESTLVDGTYNLEIDHDSDPPNFSIQFTISGGLLSSTSGSSTTSASVTSTKTSTVASVTTTSTSTASNASNSSSVSKTASSTTKPSKSSYTDEIMESTNNNLGSSSTASSTATTSIPASNNAAQCTSSFAFVLMSFVAIAALN